MDIEAELSKFQHGSKDRMFLEKVFDKLGPNFARKSLLEKAKEARLKRDEVMQRHFEREIVKDAVNRAVAEQETQMALSLKVHPFYLEQARKYLPEDETSNVSRFCGLTKKNIPENSLLQSAAFQRLVCEKLKEFFGKIVEYSGGSMNMYDWNTSLDEALKNIKSKIDFYLSSKKDDMDSRKQLKDVIELYHKELGNNLMLLVKLLELHQEKLDFEATTSQRYMLHCCALAKKTELLHMKLNLATYNLKTLPALKHISSELNRKEEMMKKEKQELIVTFEKYSELGEEYESIVDEIMELTKKIEEEEHSIARLKSLMPDVSHSDTSVLE